MDLVQSLAAATDRLTAALPADAAAIVKQELDGLAALLSTENAEAERLIALAADALTRAGRQLLGADSAAALGQQLLSALTEGKQIEFYPGYPMIFRLGERSDEAKLGDAEK